MKKEAMVLKESKKQYMGEFEGEKVREKCSYLKKKN